MNTQKRCLSQQYPKPKTMKLIKEVRKKVKQTTNGESARKGTDFYLFL